MFCSFCATAAELTPARARQTRAALIAFMFLLLVEKTSPAN
jgi:hypothetical protein